MPAPPNLDPAVPHDVSLSSPLGIVLAAGKGTRMRSELPKVLFPACGRPMVRWVIDALRDGGAGRIVVVVGYRSDLLRAELAGEPRVEFVEQTEQLGTGHAVMMARRQLLEHAGPAIVVTGDSPLLQGSSLRTLLAEFAARPEVGCLIGSVRRDDPTGFGRIVRDAAGRFVRIVEEKDATAAEQAITEINVSTYVFAAQALAGALDELRADNAQRELYITDCPAILQRQGRYVEALPVLEPCEALGVNSIEELASVEAEMVRLGVA